jgi:hypothetical protein
MFVGLCGPAEDILSFSAGDMDKTSINSATVNLSEKF